MNRLFRIFCAEYIRVCEDLETLTLYVTRPAGRGTRWS